MPATRVLRQQELGLTILLVSLGVFFLAALSAFALISPAYQARRVVPPVLWASTVVLIAGAACQQRALFVIRRERRQPFRVWLTAGLIAGLLFVALQGLGLWQLIDGYLAVGTAPPVWACLFVLIALHAAHVLVGVVALALVTLWGWQGRYDHEFFTHVVLCTRYWHFLDAVWLVMLAAFLLISR